MKKLTYLYINILLYFITYIHVIYLCLNFNNEIMQCIKFNMFKFNTYFILIHVKTVEILKTVKVNN